nr:exosome complex protein Rrp42 [Candidatus Woesearchaeota archaeon]
MEKKMYNELRDYMIALFAKNMRKDGRKLLDYRKPIRVEYDISPKSAEGSARVTIGKTEVIAGVKMEVGEPFPDTPNQGVLIVSAELVPLASPEFESGPPDIQAIELSRVVDRGLRESKAIDLDKLCVKEGEKVWIVFIDIYPINDSGNLFDAASLAAIAALKNAKMPKYDAKEDKIIYGEATNKKIPLNKTPISCTISKIGNYILVDPSYEEERVLDARLTVTSEKGVINAMQKGGINSLSHEDIMKMVDIAIEKSRELEKAL